MRASGFLPTWRALSADAMTSPAAPSLMPDALPAVTVPSFWNAGFSAASFSTVVPARGYSSTAKRIAVALLLFQADRHDLVDEGAGGNRRGGAPLALGRERILILARHAEP